MTFTAEVEPDGWFNYCYLCWIIIYDMALINDKL